MTVLRNKWKKVNRCVVCGTRLTFTPSKRTKARPTEGEKWCAQNHEKFSVIGLYDEAGEWQVFFRLP